MKESLKTQSPKSDRILWVDCTKAVAIFAVVVDHSYRWLYNSAAIQCASFYSVTLFVLLAGMLCKPGGGGNTSLLE